MRSLIQKRAAGFGNSGKIITDIGTRTDDQAFGVAVQNNGKIVVAGSSSDVHGNYNIAVVRYNSNGSLDTSWNGTGKLTTAIGSGNYQDGATSVVLQGDGKIIIAGDSLISTASGENFYVALVRYNSNGSLDTSFNGTGKVTSAVPYTGHGSFLSQMALQSDGKIIIVKSRWNGIDYDFAALRYNANGSLDTSFGTSGRVVTAVGPGYDQANGVAVQSDGQIVVVGQVYTSSIYSSSSHYEFGVVRYLGGMSFTVSGTVRDGAGLPLAGSMVTLKRGSTIYWQGTTAANGTFQDPSVSAGNYTLVVTKSGYESVILNFDGTTGGNPILNVTLNPLPSAPYTVETSQTPPNTSIRPTAPANSGDPNAPKLLRYDGAGHFIPSTLADLDQNKMTIVLSHGWLSDPNAWALPLALLIQQHNGLGANAPNIIAWDWHNQANTLTPSPDVALEQGIELGKALRTALGTSYSKRLHFIGHSNGTIVNAYACDYVHGSFARAANNPTNPWNSLLTTPHVTLLDEAELATVFGQNVTTAAAIGWKVAQLKGALIAGGVAAAADWKNTIPTAAKWVDNYISLVGLQRDGAINVCLLAPTVSFDWLSPVNSLESAHAYAHLWYRNTVFPSGLAPSVGYGKSYESALAFPPTGTGLSPASVWIENLATLDPLDLLLDTNPIPLESNLAILSALMVQPAAGIATLVKDITYTPLDAVGREVLSGYEAGIQWAGNIGGTVIYTTGQVVAETKEKLGLGWDAAQDSAANILNSINPDSLLAGPVTAPVFSILLSTQPPPPRIPPHGVAGIADAPPAGQPAYAWLTINVPTNAGMIAFDFTVTGDPVDDSIVCAVNGTNIFTLPAKYVPDGSPVSTDMMNIAPYAGQSVELFFGLIGGTSTNCQVAIDGVRFITIPLPKVGLVTSGAQVSVKWPAAAVGWILESSDTLSPESWQPVSMAGVTVGSGVATIQHPKSSARRFYRLRRNS